MHDFAIISGALVAYKNGFNGDCCRTYFVGNVSEEAKRLTEVTKQSFYEGIKYAKKGFRLGDICHAIGEYVEKNKIAIDEVEKINVSLLHGKIGAHIAKTLYDVSEQIQKAIEYHTETSPNMDELAKIIYVSDKIERNRKSEKFDLDAERELARKDLDGAVLFIIDASIEKLVKKEKLMHPTIVKTRNKLLMERM